LYRVSKKPSAAKPRYIGETKAASKDCKRPMLGQEAWGLTFLEVEKIERHP
jgi:hypothetical protein